MQSTVSFGQALPGAALTGAVAGLGTAAAIGSSGLKLGSMTLGAGPVGLAVGLGTALFSLF